jgi:hypothetical protein
MHRRSRILFISLLVQMILFRCEPVSMKSSWTNQSIVIDGKDADWQSVSLHRLESWDVSLGLCNDADDLYLLLYFENPMLMMVGGTRGIVLEFIHSRTHEVIFELHITGMDSLAPAFEPEDSFWQCLNADQKEEFMSRQIILKNKITVMKKENTVKIPADGSQGLSAARVYHPMFCGYELRIPIRKNGDTPYALGTGLGETVNIKIRMGEQKEKDESFNMSPMGGMSGTPPMDGSGRAFPGGPSVMNEEVLVSIVLAEKH